MGDSEVFPNYSFKLEGLKGAETGVKFFSTDLPASTVAVTGVKAWNDKGKSAPLAGGGHQVTWNPISMTRYLDGTTALYDWYMEVCEKGAIEGVVQEPTITCLNNDEPLFMWKLHEAVPTGYSQNAANAQSSDLLTETVTITFTHAEMSRS
jgi:phage tail-like protein